MTEKIERFYDDSPEAEWNRLSRHKMEFRTSLRAMHEFIPRASSILDVGGGPGRYSIELARAGHAVTLLDLSVGNIELGKRRAVENEVSLTEYVHGNALDLSRFTDGSFDVVLLMGPLYHLVHEKDRDRAVAESLRALKPGGLLFAAFVNRYAFLVDTLRSNPAQIAAMNEIHEDILKTGVNMHSEVNLGFTDAYFAHPMEIEPFMSRHGLSTLRLATAEALVAAAEDAVNALPDELFDRWVDMSYRLGTDPTTWSSGEHMLYVGRKPE